MRSTETDCQDMIICSLKLRTSAGGQKKHRTQVQKFMAGVAQLVRASVCGTECRQFESGHPPHPSLPMAKPRLADLTAMQNGMPRLFSRSFLLKTRQKDGPHHVLCLYFAIDK